jgi:hypothetical protein
MNFMTPAIAINYEHKSAGIMQQLGLPEMAVDIRHLLDGSLEGWWPIPSDSYLSCAYVWRAVKANANGGWDGAVGFNAY